MMTYLKSHPHTLQITLAIVLGMLAAMGLYLASRYNYLLFHTLVEMFSIVVAYGMFIITWNTRHIMVDGYLQFLGMGFLFIGTLDMLHTLSYRGMTIFPGYDTNLPTQLWIAARYLQSLSFLVAPLKGRWKQRPNLVLATYSAISLGLLIAVFSGYFPPCFVEGSGLTTFKIVSELLIIGLFLSALVIMQQHRSEFDNHVHYLIMTSLVITVCSEMAFVLYDDPYGFPNFIGHSLKGVAWYLIYKAMIETGLSAPYRLLFRTLKQREEHLQLVNDQLQQEILQRQRSEEERWQTTTTLERTVATLNSILDSSPNAITVTDLEGRIIECNQAALAVHDFPSKEEFLGKYAFELIAPEERERAGRNLERALQEGGLKHVEYTLLTKHHRRFAGELSIGIIPDASGDPMAFVANTHNITERKHTEEQLRKLSVAVEQSPSIVVITDTEGAIEYVNPKFSHVTGYRTEEVLGKNPRVLNSGIQPATYYKELWSTIRSGQEWHGEFCNQKKDGSLYWEFASIASIKNTDGQITHFFKVSEDITERKRAEEELKASRESYQMLTELSRDMISYHAADGTYLYASPASQDLLGYQPEELVGRDPYELFHPDDTTKVAEHHEQTLEGIKMPPIIYRLRHKDGHYIWVETSNRFIWDPEIQAIINIVCVSRDVTARKQTEQELRQAKQAAEAANRAKSTFLANMSHELRTPLNAVLGYTQILKRDTHLNERQRASIEVIHRSGEHLLMLINDVLDISKIEVGSLTLQPGAVNFPAFLEALVQLIRIRAFHQNVDFVCEVTEDVPVTIDADEKRLRQVLFNLLDNAVKFTPNGQVTFRVQRRSIQHPSPTSPHPTHCLRFEIEDTGIGISAEQVEEIFLPFHQQDDVLPTTEGTGLGLAISQQLVHMMGSRLRVDTRPGQGSRFWFDLSLQEIPDKLSEPPTASLCISGFKGKERTILVVDDSPANQTILHEILAPLGFRVLEASNGEKALKIVDEESPDLILMDTVMPGMDGIEATRRIRQMPECKDCPIIAISANTLSHVQQQCRDAGCDDFIEKPISTDRLLEKIDKSLHIDWVYESPEAARQDTSELPTDRIIPPGREELVILFELAEDGDIMGIQTYINKLEQQNQQLEAFAQKIRTLAQQFEVSKLSEVIQSYLYEEESYM